MAQKDNAETVFAAAIAIASPQARSAYLDQACQADPSLHCKVERLVADYFRAGDFLEQPVAQIAAPLIDPPPREHPGTQIGPYTLLEQLGEGGMGVVYVAEQREPIRRTVALKIIKPGMDSREVVARFAAERQALARMDHPNIAQVFDAGATDAGRPYFVMELVRGIPITEFCDQQRLTTRERLALFVTLCHGVQHAHQKGVIHRDLKPSNVLVEVHDVRPVPKIIDFGIATPLGQQLTEKTFHTAQSQMVGTPLYMSPEQAGQSVVDVDTRSDIYSLGVLLYELLTGSTPFEKDTLRAVGVDELRRIIRDVEPLRPSARVSTLQAADQSTISERRHIEPRKLSQELRGDLDWIVMKAIDKDRDRRYASASALATDVQRYLDHEPVQARPPSWAHHAAKWVRRHRPLVWSSAAVLAVTVVAGGVLFGTSYRRAALLERDAGEHLAAATAFLGSGDYTAADRELAEAWGRLEAAGSDTGPLADQLTDLTAAIAAKTQSIWDFEQFQALRHRIHSAMYALDRTILDQAQTHCRTALDLFGVFAAEPWKSQADFENLDPARQAMLDEGAVELLFLWARLEMGKSESQPATERSAGYRRAMEALGKIETFHPPIPAVALWMADGWEALGEQQAAAEARAQAASLQPTSATDYYLLGEHHAQHGQQEQALASYWQTLTQQSDHYLSVLAARVALGELKEYKSAEAMLTGAIAMNPHKVIAYLKRAPTRREQSKIVLAMADVEEAQKRDPELARALIRRADEYREKYQFDNALADYDEAMRLDPQAAAYGGRGFTYALQGDQDKALADVNDAIRVDPVNGLWYARRGYFYLGRREFDKAAADLDRAVELAPIVSVYHKHWATAHFHLKQYDKALAGIAKAVELDPGDFSNLTWLPLREVAMCPDEPLRKGLLDLADKTIQSTNGAAEGYVSRACLYDALGRPVEARADFEKAIQLEPRDAALWIARAALHCVWQARRAEAFTDVSKLDHDYPDFWSLQGMAWLGGGKAAEHRSDCAGFFRRLSQTEKPDEANRAAWACVLAPDAIQDWPTAVALAEKAVQSDPKSAMYLNTLGAVLYRAGRFDEALARLSEVEPLVQAPGEALKSPPAYTWFFLAMTQQRMGHTEEAKQWLDKAAAGTDKILAEADQGTADLSWNRRLTLKLLRDEATALLGVTPPAVEPAPAAKVEGAQELPQSAPAPEAAKEEEKPQ